MSVTREEIAAFLVKHTAALGARDVAALCANYTSDAVIVSPMFATLHGVPAIETSLRAFFTAFPDWTMQFDAYVIDPPHAALFSTAHATHEAEFFGIPGTHRRIDVYVALHLTFRDGLISHERRIYDFTGLLLQIGVLRAKPAKP
jgi:predicted ester cyclase